MTRYIVRWEIDIEASSPEAAAEMALHVHRDPQSQATAFAVARDEPVWILVNAAEPYDPMEAATRAVLAQGDKT